MNRTILWGIFTWHEHEWTKWETTKTGTVKSWERLIGNVLVQERTCTDCGFTEQKMSHTTVCD